MLDDEDSNNITVGSLVTVLVKLTRQTMAVSSLFGLFIYIYLLFWRLVYLLILCECTCACTWVHMRVCRGYRSKSDGVVLFFEMVSLIGIVFANLVRIPGQLVPRNPLVTISLTEVIRMCCPSCLALFFIY